MDGGHEGGGGPEAVELSAYELERLANIERNEAVLVALGLLDRSPSKEEEEEEERAARQEARRRAERKRVATRSAAPQRKSPRLVAQADGAASRAELLPPAAMERRAPEAAAAAPRVRKEAAEEASALTAEIAAAAATTAAAATSEAAAVRPKATVPPEGAPAMRRLAAAAGALVFVRDELTASGFKGVFHYKDGWQAVWPCYLGKSFATAEGAAAAIAQHLGASRARAEAEAAAAAADARRAEPANGLLGEAAALRGAAAEGCVLERSTTLPSGYVGVYGTKRRRRPWCAMVAGRSLGATACAAESAWRHARFYKR